MDGPALTEQEIQRFQEAFYSKGLGPGELTPAKVQPIAEALGLNIPPTRIQGLCKRLNSRGGTFEFRDLLLALAAEAPIPIAQSDIRTAFEVFDKDKNGVITKDELYSVLTNLDERVSTEELNSIMKAIDPNGDGKIDYREFVELLTK